MEFNNARIMEIVRNQLALDYNCKAEDFLSNGVFFYESVLNEGRRMLERQSPYIEIATMGKGIVVSADADDLERVKPILENKFRDDLFFAPFLFGHSLYYVPECNSIRRLPCPSGFTTRVAEGSEIYGLYNYSGFINALQYDEKSAHPDYLALYAVKNDEIAGIACASIDSGTMWQIGIDVLPRHRNAGLAVYLVSNLALMVMERGILPYYGTASSNIASQKVAYRSGFNIAWMCNYKNTLDCKSPFLV